MLSCFEEKNQHTGTHTKYNLANHSHHSTFYNSGINHWLPWPEASVQLV